MVQQAKVDAILQNVRCMVDPVRRFPQRVFLGAWDSISFFDSDWVFDAGFVAWAKALLQAEGASYACIFDLDTVSGRDASGRSTFIIDGKTSGNDYQSFLKGPDAAPGWIFTVDRFACTSDEADWCIYCERANEIAAIAMRSAGLRHLLADVKAEPIERALAMQISYGFSERALSPDWRSELLGQYRAPNGG